jgi:ABC-type multidrug transport system fused ATPase/permease subunit
VLRCTLMCIALACLMDLRRLATGVCLYNMMRDHFGVRLHVRMAEAGDNLSVGQRQLFCLAR